MPYRTVFFIPRCKNLSLGMSVDHDSNLPLGHISAWDHVQACFLVTSCKHAPASSWVPSKHGVITLKLLLRLVVWSFDHFALFLAPFADSLYCKSCEFLLSEICDGPISLVATEEGAAEYGTVAVALRRKFGANPSTNGNAACGASDGAKCPV